MSILVSGVPPSTLTRTDCCAAADTAINSDRTISMARRMAHYAMLTVPCWNAGWSGLEAAGPVIRTAIGPCGPGKDAQDGRKATPDDLHGTLPPNPTRGP